jgi:hypothetical protein
LPADSDPRPGGDFPITDREHRLAQWLRVDLTSRAADDLLASAVEKANRSAQLIVEVGLELMAAKAQCEHGQWAERLESIGMESQRASEFMRYAQFAGRLSPKERERVIGLPKKKVLALAGADPEVVADLIEHDEKFEATTALNVSDMRKRIKRLEKDKLKLQGERDAFRDRANALQTQNYGAESSYPYPDFVAVARRESNKLTDKAQLCIDDLRQLAADHAQLKDTITDDRVMEFWNTGVAAIYYNAKALAARAVEMIELVEQAMPEAVSGEFKAEYLYHESDIEQAVRDREVLVQMHRHDHVRRELHGRPSKGGRKK